MITRTPLKKAISIAYAQDRFPSTWYKSQSPFKDGAHPTSSWNLPYNAIRAQFWQLNGHGLVMFQLEWAVLLVEDFNIDPSTLVFLSDSSLKTKFARQLGIRVIESQGPEDMVSLQELTNMKPFDYVLKNAPWDKGLGQGIDLPFNRTTAYATFNYFGHSLLADQGICLDILPSNWMCMPDYQGWRNWMLENFEILNISIWDNSQGEVFDGITMSDVITMVSRRTLSPTNTSVEYVSYGGVPFTVDLTRYNVWPMYKSPISIKILDEVMRSKVRDLSTGTEAAPPVWFVSASNTRAGKRQNPTPRNDFTKGTLKAVACPIWLGYSSQQSLDTHWEWMATTHYAYVLSMLQSSPKRQPIFYSMLGEHDFQNNDFYTHFNVTPTHDREIQQWYNLIK
jgi:hypothetical protein